MIFCSIINTLPSREKVLSMLQSVTECVYVLQNEVLIIHSQERGIQTPTNTPSPPPPSPQTRVENNPGSSYMLLF